MALRKFAILTKEHETHFDKLFSPVKIQIEIDNFTFYTVDQRKRILEKAWEVLNYVSDVIVPLVGSDAPAATSV